MRTLTWPVMNLKGVLRSTAVLSTPHAAPRVYMRPQPAYSSCLLNGPRICQCFPIYLSETRWESGILLFLTLIFLAHKVSYFQAHCILIGRYDYLPMPLKIIYHDPLLQVLTHHFREFRWFYLRKRGVSCFFCVQFSGHYLWTTAPCCPCLTSRPRDRAREALPLQTWGSFKKCLAASSPCKWIQLSLHAWKPLFCSNQVGFSYKKQIANITKTTLVG